MLKAYFLIAISGLSVLPVALSAEEQTATWVNTYGVSGGLIDMPTAEVGPDGRLITTISHFGGTTKTNLSFQLTPRISGVFRYSGIKGLTAPGSGLSTYFDRSFDVHCPSSGF
ncbi:MAG: YjbH domain-containing protein, partial [Lentibacter algarum]|uniref:YjbH domain-containing protein n=1 Tax=Lentibacter algarum TaxID=576131 RepID=UPI003B8B6F0F